MGSSFDPGLLIQQFCSQFSFQDLAGGNKHATDQKEILADGNAYV
jgi:hypothetical protein